MSYDRSFTRGRGRGRGSFNDGGSRPSYSKYEDRSPKEDFSERGFSRGSRRPQGGFVRSNYGREDYAPIGNTGTSRGGRRRSSRDSYERDSYRGSRDTRREVQHERNYTGAGGGGRRSPSVEYRKEVVRGRPLSPPPQSHMQRKEYMGREAQDGRLRDYGQQRQPPGGYMDIRRHDGGSYGGGGGRRNYTPPIMSRERHVSPFQRYGNDRYDSPRQRTYERDVSFNDRRRSDFHRQSNPRESREYRSRSPNIRTRGGGGGRFNSQRGGRGRDNFNSRYESDQRNNFNRSRDEPSIRRGRFNDTQKRKVEPALGGGIPVAKKSRDSSFDST